MAPPPAGRRPSRAQTRRRPETPAYFAHVVPGLEQFAVRDVEASLPSAKVVETLTGFDERAGIVLFSHSGGAEHLLALRSVEDVFALVLDVRSLPSDRRALRRLRAALVRNDGLERALGLAAHVRRRRKAARPTFRVIARIAGRAAYRRVDLQRAVEDVLLERFPSWRLVEDGARFEFWVHMVRGRLLVGLRVSDAALRHRTYLVESRVAALKPTIAYAMVMLSEPTPDDVFLDPMCGAGTILIERALLGPYRLLIGGDVDAAAVEAAGANIGPRHKPIKLERWDARRLPLDDGSVDALVTNLPFGKRIGSAADLDRLYREALREWARVLRPGGRSVLLTSRRGLLRNAVAGNHALSIVDSIDVIVRGLEATIFVLRSS